MGDSNTQNRTEYAPSLAARKLLEVRLDPEHRLKPIIEQCRIADISRDSYYRFMEDDGYIEWEKAEAVKRLGRYVAPVLSAYIKEAIRGSKQHGDTILEITGIHSSKQRMEVTGKDGGPLDVRAILPRDEVERLLREQGILPQGDENGEG